MIDEANEILRAKGYSEAHLSAVAAAAKVDPRVVNELVPERFAAARSLAVALAPRMPRASRPG